MILLGWVVAMLVIWLINLDELPKVRRGYFRSYVKRIKLP